MAQLWLLCALSVALCKLGAASNEILHSGATATFNVTKSEVTDSWQSSEFNNRCFRDTAVAGSWDYFHTLGTPDSHGYQWLLIKLTRPIRVQSVTVYGRESDSSRAENIEILLSDRLPTGLNASNDRCYATLSDSLSSLTHCGVTRKEESRTHRVACSYSDCTNMTEYVLLRKYVRNETDMYMNFQALEIKAFQTAQLFRCKTSGPHIYDCRLGGLQLLKNRDSVLMKLCPPCNLQSSDAVACHIATLSGRIEQLRVNRLQTGKPELVSVFRVSSEVQGGSFTCNFICSDGSTHTAAEPIGYTEDKPRDVSIRQRNAVLVGSRTFLAAGRNFLFSFISEAAYPNPIHTCRLVNSVEQPMEEITSGQLLPSFSQKAQTYASANISHAISLISEYNVSVSTDMNGQWIQCASVLQGTSVKTVRSIQLPELVEPSKPKFLLPSNSSWKDGAYVGITVDSTNGSRVATSHSCYLETQGSNKSLTAISTTNTSSTFNISVSKRWGDSASLVCLVNQSGLIESWARCQLPKVLYRAEGLAIILSEDLLSDQEASFVVTASDPGYPPPLHQCGIGNENLVFDKTPGSNGTSFWRFTPSRSHNGDQIRCKIVQNLDGVLIFDQSVNSSALNVKYNTTVIWPSSLTQEVKEGEPLSLYVVYDGNPEPTVQCWVHLISGAQVNLSQVEHSRNDSKFSITADRSMNGGNLTCLETQLGLQSSIDRRFTQSVTVFYQPRPPLSIDLAQTVYETVMMNFTVKSGEGNPSVTHTCTSTTPVTPGDPGVDHGKVEILSSKAVASEYLTVMEYTPRHNDRFIDCTAEQTHHSKDSVVFRNSIRRNITVNYIALNYMDVNPSETVFAGSKVEVSLTSSGGRPAVSDHECWLGGSQLTMENRTVLSNRVHFAFRAQKEHNEKLLICKFVQDERLNGWQSRSIGVFYKADVDSTIELRSANVRQNSTVYFKLHLNDQGNPPAQKQCYIGSRRLVFVPLLSASNASSIWKFQAEVEDNGQQFICQVIQKDLRGVTAFNQTVRSKALDVLYPARFSEFLTQPLSVMEGDPLIVTFRSVGGNPKPSQHCWLLTSGSRKDIVAVDKRRAGEELITNFSVNSTRQMNGRPVVCRVSQEGIEDLAMNFDQNISVFFRSEVNLTGSRISGTTVVISINVTDGNPMPLVNCSLLTNSWTRQASMNVSAAFSVGVHSVPVSLDSVEQSRSVNISCSIEQDYERFRNNNLAFMQLKANELYQNDHEERGSAGSAIGASFGTLLAVALVVAAILLLLKARRRRQHAVVLVPGVRGGGGGTGGRSNGTSSTNRSSRTDARTRKKEDNFEATEMEFMETHYLYRNKPRMEYATVVKVELVDASLADSTDTIYLTIVGSSQPEDDEVQTPKSEAN